MDAAARPDEWILPDFLWDKGGAHFRPAISDVPLLREAGMPATAAVSTKQIWVRWRGYDPLVPEGDLRVRHVRLEDEPGLRLPAEDDPEQAAAMEEPVGAIPSEPGRALRPAARRTPGSRGTVKAAIEWLEQAPPQVGAVLTLARCVQPRTGRGQDPPQPYRDQYMTVEPDEFESGDEGDLVDEASEEDAEEIDIAEVPVLIDVPAGPVGDVLSEAELFRLRRTYAGTVTLVDRWLGELFDAMRRLGRFEDTLLVFTSDQGEPLGEHGYVRRFRPWLYEELIPHAAHRAVCRCGHPARWSSPPGPGAKCRPLADHRLGFGFEADRPRPGGTARPRPAPLDPWRAVQAPRLRLHGDGRRGVRHPNPPPGT